MSELLNTLENGECEIDKKFPMNRYITLKVGGDAEAVVYPRTVPEFINVLDHVHNSGIKFIVLSKRELSGIQSIVLWLIICFQGSSFLIKPETWSFPWKRELFVIIFLICVN